MAEKKLSGPKQSSKFWDHNESILNQWVQKRYIRNRSLTRIPIKPNIDSIFWKFFMTAKEEIDSCLRFRVGSPLRNLGAIEESLIVRSYNQSCHPLAEKRVCDRIPTKFSIILWIIK